MQHKSPNDTAAFGPHSVPYLYSCNVERKVFRQIDRNYFFFLRAIPAGYDMESCIVVVGRHHRFTAHCCWVAIQPNLIPKSRPFAHSHWICKSMTFTLKLFSLAFDRVSWRRDSCAVSGVWINGRVCDHSWTSSESKLNPRRAAGPLCSLFGGAY